LGVLGVSGIQLVQDSASGGHMWTWQWMYHFHQKWGIAWPPK